MNNKEKIEYLTAKYYYRMHKTAMGILNDYHLAEDACQETLIKLMQISDKLDDVTTEKIRNLCFVILKNSARDILRKWFRQVPYEEIYDDDTAPSVSDKYPYETDDLVNDIMLLPDIYLIVVKLRCIEERSSKETADYLGSNVPTVNARLSRAKKMLKKKWDTVA